MPNDMFRPPHGFRDGIPPGLYRCRCRIYGTRVRDAVLLARVNPSWPNEVRAFVFQNAFSGTRPGDFDSWTAKTGFRFSWTLTFRSGLYPSAQEQAYYSVSDLDVGYPVCPADMECPEKG